MVMTAPQRSAQHRPLGEQPGPCTTEEHTEPVAPEGQVEPSTPRELFESLPPTLRLRAEIIDGNLIVSPSGTPITPAPPDASAVL